MTAQNRIDDPGESTGFSAGVIADGGFYFLFQCDHGFHAFNQRVLIGGGGDDLDDVRVPLFQEQGKLHHLNMIHRDTGMTGKKHLRTGGMYLLDQPALPGNDRFIRDDLLGIVPGKGIAILTAEGIPGGSVEGVALHIDTGGTGLHSP